MGRDLGGTAHRNQLDRHAPRLEETARESREAGGHARPSSEPLELVEIDAVTRGNHQAAAAELQVEQLREGASRFGSSAQPGTRGSR